MTHWCQLEKLKKMVSDINLQYIKETNLIDTSDNAICHQQVTSFDCDVKRL